MSRFDNFQDDIAPIQNNANNRRVQFGVDEDNSATNELTYYLDTLMFTAKQKSDFCYNPLIFWNSKPVRNRLPILRLVALDELVNQAGSSPSERIFSVVGNIVTSKRANLSDLHVSMLVFLHDWYKNNEY